MWNEIESYIKQNREDLDQDLPREDLWADIDKKLGNQPTPLSNVEESRDKVRQFSFYRLAASLLILVGVGYVGMKVLPWEMNIPMRTSLLDNEQHQTYPELSEQDRVYVSEANELLQAINSYDLHAHPFMDEYRDEIKQLEKRFESLKDRLDQGGYSDRLHNDIVLSYNAKVALLKDILAKLKAAD
ncbi:MAG: hypothetical protein AAFR61_10860 [Bacteroidota bacterium]